MADDSPSSPIKSEVIQEVKDDEEEDNEEEREPEIPLHQAFSFNEAVQLMKSKKSCEVLGQPQNLKLIAMLDDQDCSLLHYAASFGRLDCCKMMIENGAKVGARNRRGENAAHMSMSNGQTECSIALLKILGENRKESPWLF